MCGLLVWRLGVFFVTKEGIEHLIDSLIPSHALNAPLGDEAQGGS